MYYSMQEAKTIYLRHRIGVWPLPPVTHHLLQIWCTYFSFYCWKTDRRISRLLLSRANRVARLKSQHQESNQPGRISGVRWWASRITTQQWTHIFFYASCYPTNKTPSTRSAHTQTHMTHVPVLLYSDNITITTVYFMHVDAHIYIWMQAVQRQVNTSLSLQSPVVHLNSPPNRNKTVVSCWNLCPWNRTYVLLD